MKTGRSVIILCTAFFLIIIFSGCTPIYVPNTVNVPTYEHAGEISAAGYVGSNGFDLQAGVAVTDNIAVTADGSFANRSNSDNKNSEHKHSFGELGINGFTLIGENGQGSLSMGIGTGKVSSSDTEFLGSDIITAEGEYTRAYWQASLGFRSRIFKGGFACRLSYVQFNSMDYNHSNATGNDWRKWEYFVEPALYMELGGRNLKFLLQGGFSEPIHKEKLFDYEPVWIAAGLKININTFN